MTKEEFPQLRIEDWQGTRVPQLDTITKEFVVEDFASKFLCKEATAAEQNGDQAAFAVFASLAHICLPILNAKEQVAEIAPVFGEPPFRADLLADAAIEVLGQVVETIEDCDLRARVADVVWSRKPHEKFAGIAASAYLESTKRLEPGGIIMWYVPRLLRGFQIAAAIKDRSTFNQFVEYTKSLSDRLLADDPMGIADDIVNVLLYHRAVAPHDLYDAAKKAGQERAAAKQWLRAMQAYESAFDCAVRLQDVERQKEAAGLIAGARIEYGEGMVKEGNHGGATWWMSSAIKAYRLAGNSYKAEIERTQKRLLELQELAAADMKEFSVKTTMSSEANKAIEDVRGKSAAEAILYLIDRIPPRKVADIRQDATDHLKDSPFASLFPKIKVADDGTVVAHSDGVSPGEQPAEDRLIQEMHEVANMGRALIGTAFIDPVRRIIQEEHKLAPKSLRDLVTNNRMVPNGREATYLLGIGYGFAGRYIEAAHILIPQLENSLRYILQKRGVIVSGFDQDGIQDKFDLNRILFEPELKKVFTPDELFDMVGLLINRHGANLRNKIAHGLMSDEDLGSSQLIYCWAMTLRLLANNLVVDGSQVQPE